uniref:MABP domain-containing protein n=1 Tax=Macrostomum lignano TaxID=282301 RepID=A0A1I8F6K0_9PLAT
THLRFDCPTSLNFVGDESSASQKKQHPENLLHEEKDSDGARVRILCWVMTQPQNYNSKPGPSTPPGRPGNCLENVGVSILDSIDEKGTRAVFNPSTRASHIDYTRTGPRISGCGSNNYHPIKVNLRS